MKLSPWMRLTLFGACTAMIGYAAFRVIGAFTIPGRPANSLEAARQRLAADDSARFVEEHMPGTPGFPDRFTLLRHALSQVSVQGGLYCEFGVFAGESINFISATVPGVTVHGFDSFEGNPEASNDFSAWRKGSFQRHGVLPDVNANVRLHKGWFDQTLPAFRSEHRESLAFAHLDADLYSSTKTVFDLLGDRLVPGTILVFDEYFNYPGWRRGEFLAFSELTSRRNLQFEYIGYSDQQVAVRIR